MEEEERYGGSGGGGRCVVQGSSTAAPPPSTAGYTDAAFERMLKARGKGRAGVTGGGSVGHRQQDAGEWGYGIR